MRALAAIILGFSAAGLLLAQPRTLGSGTGFGNVVFPGTGQPPPGRSGFGNVVFPGTGGPPRPSTFSITDPGFARGLSGVVSGRAPYASMFPDRGRRFVYVPYVYPVYAGPYVDPLYQAQPNVTVVYPQQQPPVVINQNFTSAPAPAPEAGPAVSVYEAPSRTAADMAAAEPPPDYYLIAFKDHSIYSAVAYYIEGDTLHYFTQGNVHNQVSLDLVDRALTEQLNRERRVDVRLSR